MAGRQDYEERKEYKKELYHERAEKAEQRSQQHHSTHRRIASIIPMGQPILIGHHSEGRHRRDIAKMDNAIGKAIQESEKADYYRNKIDSIDNNNVISSDDPKAIEKLQAKIKMLEEAKVKVKARKHEWYELPYINADIKRTKNRIKEIQALEGLQFDDIIFNGGRATRNKDLNRVQFMFQDIPSEEVRTLLKRHGFHWSRYQGAWQRLYSKNGIRATRYVIEELETYR